MKSAIVLYMFMALAYAQYGGNLYGDQYDNIDTGQVLFISRRLMPLVECILDITKCTPPTREMQSIVKAAMEAECSECPSDARRAFKHEDNSDDDEETYLNYIVPVDDDHKNNVYEIKLPGESKAILRI